MTWNYRVIRHVAPDLKERYAIHHAYYEEGEVVTLSQGPVSIDDGESVDDLANDLALFAEALTKPVLDFKTLRPI